MGLSDVEYARGVVQMSADKKSNPEKYFRISRSFYVSVDSIDQIHDYFGNRLLLNLTPALDKEALVSREKVMDFKKWMGK